MRKRPVLSCNPGHIVEGQHLTTANLSDRERLFLSESIFDGYSHADIANRHDVSKATVDSHIRRAKAKLKSVGLEATRRTREDEPVLIRLPDMTTVVPKGIAWKS